MRCKIYAARTPWYLRLLGKPKYRNLMIHHHPRQGWIEFWSYD